MPDRKKVIKGLYYCSNDCSRICPYYDADGCNALLARDALALLKEQDDKDINVPVKIVRCKDCKHGALTIINGVLLLVTCGNVDHRPEWFCADGEERR